jgi:WD40 repeat protein
VTITHDSLLAVTASLDYTAKVWDMQSGKCVQTLKGHSDGIESVAISHDSQLVVTGSWDKTAKVWNVQSGKCVQTLKGHSEWVISVAMSHDSQMVVTGSHDRTAKVWNVQSGKCLQTLKGHKSHVTSVTITHDSLLAVTASLDYTAKVWNVQSGECEETIPTGKALYRTGFHAKGQFPISELGPLPFRSLSTPPPPADDSTGDGFSQSLDLSGDGKWIMYCTKNLVWIPTEYRPSRSAVSDTILGVGVGSGRVWMASVMFD